MKINFLKNLSGLGLIIGLGLAPAVMAQNLSYSGKVVDASGTAIQWALIRLDGGAWVAQSDVNGNFTLTGTAAMALYPEIRPNPMQPMSLETDAAPARFLSNGRNVSVTHAAAGASFLRPTAGWAPVALEPTSRNNPALESSPPLPPLAKSLATAVVGVTKVTFQDGTFPQTTASAKGLVLTLAKSTTDTAIYAAAKKICLDTVNACRATLGLKPLAWSTSLEAFADEGARYDAGVNAAHSHFGKFDTYAIASAENALPGWPLKDYKTVGNVIQQGTKSMWGEGPGGGHYENIKGDHTTVGCGVFITTAGNVWIVQDFK